MIRLIQRHPSSGAAITCQFQIGKICGMKQMGIQNINIKMYQCDWMFFQKFKYRFLTDKLTGLHSIGNIHLFKEFFLIIMQSLQSDVQNILRLKWIIFSMLIQKWISLSQQSAENHSVRIWITIRNFRNIRMSIQPDDTGIRIQSVQIVKKSQRNQAVPTDRDNSVRRYAFQNNLCLMYSIYYILLCKNTIGFFSLCIIRLCNKNTKDSQRIVLRKYAKHQTSFKVICLPSPGRAEVLFYPAFFLLGTDSQKTIEPFFTESIVFSLFSAVKVYEAD